MYRYYLAVRYLLSRPINLLGVFGIMLGVWALIVVVSIFSGFLREVVLHLRGATADLTATVIPEDAEYPDLRELVEADGNVAAVAPRLLWYGLLHPTRTKSGDAPPPPPAIAEIGADTRFVTVVGIDPDAERFVTELPDWLTNVDDPDLRVADVATPLPAATAIDDGPALPPILLGVSRLQRDGLRRGDIVSMTTGVTSRDRDAELVDFEERRFRVAGAFSTSYAGFDNLNVFVRIDDLRGLLGFRHERTGELAIKLHDADRSAATATRDRLRRSLAPPIRVRTGEEANRAQLGSIDHQRGLMKLVLIVILVVAAFLMYATLSMMVTEKTHDIGILTAMGANAGGVMTVFLACGVAIALVGTALGVATGCLSAIYLDDFNQWLRATFDIDLFPTRIYNLKRVPWDLDPWWICEVSLMAIGTGVVVSALPAWKAARHDPLHSLREE